ncbi:MAG: helix-turn-helix domain-containing protein [Candidatus Aminicenantes bacterium]|nr:helix-turn-helix domain-containing protein [Candidatus Aminicenantes bacterium]NIM79001.1 helix-turn-helix domain-containing protein [Candidatus Aminicenantes bacterium]NIN18259.1 helix-turn-helix domain-containing protein [Candidatus Aminicenantes bacterium]NIN42156.1 helix-turn-helix domain-containing protein [Candidatus Aminicenantes bacterium]NIN84912.1 helix-turn-helix domain-containing protein [Candidatus Aminicenantes bacterium]
MNRKKRLEAIGSRLRRVRMQLGYSQKKMASYFGIQQSGYTKNEMGGSVPGLHTLIVLSSTFGISLDWLLCEKGPMYYKEKESSFHGGISEIGPADVRKDVKELLETMERIPLLCYQVLSFFQKFKVENKELIESVIKEAEKA